MMRKAVLRLGGGALAATGAFAAYELATDERARKAVAPGSAVDLHGIARFSRTIGNVLVTAADYKLTLYNQDKERDYDAYKEALRGANLRAAKRLLRVCHTNGGLYTKFGQGIANMNHAVPPEFTDTLAPLQDQAKEMPEEIALEAVQAELGKPINEVFSEFNPKPIAAASLAQVHRAVLRGSGEAVAVKVQYPYLRAQTEGDLATLQLITELVGYWFPDFSYTWLTPEFRDNMELELDFVQEGYNGERLRKMFEHRTDVLVPRVHWELTTRRLLVMDFIDRIKINNLEALEQNGINPLEVADTVSSVFGDMIHVHGFVHCDPHPGNLGVVPYNPASLQGGIAKLSALGYAAIPLVLGTTALAAPGSPLALAGAATAIAFTAVGGIFSLLSSESNRNKRSFGGVNGASYKLVVLDHGMYRRLDPDFRSTYCMLWKALLLRDAALGRTAAVRLGVPAEHYDVLSMIFTFRSPSSAGKTGERMDSKERAQMRAQYKDTTMGDVNAFLQMLPRDLLFVMRSTNIVRSINLSLGGTSRSRFKIMGESAVRGVLIPNPVASVFTEACVANPELSYHGPYSINIPVASELVDAETITWTQFFEVKRLQMYLSLIDRSWDFVARIVKML